MTNPTNSNERLLHLRARKQAQRDLITRLTSAFGVRGAHDLLLEAATDLEEMLDNEAAAPAHVVAAPAHVAAAPSAPAAHAPTPAHEAPAPAGRAVKRRASAKAAPAAAPKNEAKASKGGGRQRAIASLLLRVLHDAAPKRLTGAEIFDELNKIRPNTKLGQVFKTLTRLISLPGTALVRKGVEGKFHYTVRAGEESSAPAAVKESSVKETAPKAPAAKAPAVKAPAVKAPAAKKGGADAGPPKTNNALVREALIKVGPTTDAAPLAQLAFGVSNAETKRKVRNALNSLLSSRQIQRRDDKAWAPLS